MRWIAKFRTWTDLAFGKPGLWAPIACAFLLVGLSRIDDGGTNAMARFATLRAMVDEHSFRIDRFQDWTLDWARTPDGHYYSNKAPGPTLIAFPLFWVIDKALFPLQERHKDAQGRRQAPRGIHKVAVSTIFQLIPFLVFSLLALKAAYPAGISTPAHLLGSLAILFGNTAAVLMSTYMGNPFAGMALMGFAYFFLRGKLGWMSLCFGWMVLADYSTALFIIPLSALLWPELRERGILPVVKSVAAGASIPALLWCGYHTICFGNPFSLPFKYDVQALEGKVAGDPAGLWGTISFLPKPIWIWELLFGMSRGILVTQPWLLLCFILIPYFWNQPDSRLRRLYWFSLSCFVILLSLTAGFPGWHAGGSPGPRYLCAALPIFGLFVPTLYERSLLPLRTILGFAIFSSIVFRALVYATWMLPAPEPIWPYYIRAIQTPKEWAYLTAFALIMGGALSIYRKNARCLQSRNEKGNLAP